MLAGVDVDYRTPVMVCPLLAGSELRIAGTQYDTEVVFPADGCCWLKLPPDTRESFSVGVSAPATAATRLSAGVPNEAMLSHLESLTVRLEAI